MMKKIILAIVIVFILVVGVLGMNSEGAYKDGEYKTKAKSRNGEMIIYVEVSKGKIKNIKIDGEEKDNGILDGVKNILVPKIIRKQSTEGIDTVTGATISSKAILNGVEEVLVKAKK